MDAPLVASLFTKKQEVYIFALKDAETKVYLGFVDPVCRVLERSSRRSRSVVR